MDGKKHKKSYDCQAPRQAKPRAAKKIIDATVDDSNFSTIEEEVGHKYQIVSQIGAGSYGNVYQAIDRETDQKVAIKNVHSIFDDLVDCKRIMREIKILRKIKSPYIVSLHDIIPPKNRKTFNSINIVLEFADSDLKKLCKSNLKLEEIHIKTLMYNIMCSLKYLHSASILHRDIKPGNILVNEDCSIRLCDFGLARSVSGVPTEINLVNQMCKDIDKGKDPCKTDELEEYKDYRASRKATMDDDYIELDIKEKTYDEKREIHFKLKKTKAARRKMKRSLTGHVVTRWYRAPELILLEKSYGSPVDIWSIGCIFGELLSIDSSEGGPSCTQRRPLFQGNSCFPLSPAKRPMIEKDDPMIQDHHSDFPIDRKDQLKMIFSMIGTPQDEMDVSFISDKQAEDYIKIFANKPGVDFEEKYPNASKEAIDLLTKMLTFNPYYRITLNEILNHDFFASVRDLEKEITSPKEIAFDFEMEGDLSEKRLRELILEEVDHFN
ncbi:unnamed protein product [Moneuplotes crassus]|uniref:Mitogen-activated protein kinase n=2 Tax=Euplotes crassus TaxID=5936 RepID=A0AAD1X3H7_EUPCR|nr:unnamed protein product [Moneuplotes crassus]